MWGVTGLRVVGCKVQIFGSKGEAFLQCSGIRVEGVRLLRSLWVGCRVAEEEGRREGSRDLRPEYLEQGFGALKSRAKLRCAEESYGSFRQ